MRLLPRLLLSVSIPLAIVMVAVGLMLASVHRVTHALEQLRVRELSSLQSEASLHRAGWGLDVALRHANERCRRDSSVAPRVRRDVRASVTELRQRLARSAGAHPTLLELSRAYLALGVEVDAAREPCARVTSAAFQRRRAVLDERFTNIWVERMGGLHDAVILREEETRRLGDTTVFGGLVLFLIAIVIATAVSFALARSVTVPLASLSRTARRVGAGELEVPVREVGGPAELIDFARELESMRRRLAELDALKQGFIASCSHELRTPLSKLREGLALLADGAAGELTTRQARIVAIARTACERQIRTVTSILDLSRLRAGAPLRTRSGSSVDAVVNAAIEQERPDAVAAGVTISTEWVGPGVRAELDDALLEHALANLVRNAVSVSPPGGEVRVVRTVEEGERPAVRVDVRDAGPGVPDELREVIFEPFVTRAVPRSPKRVGVGLGLSLAREVAEAHGGALSLRSTSSGSTFSISIPWAPDR